LFELVHGLIDLSLGQLNSVLNCSGKFLDLIFASHMPCIRIWTRNYFQSWRRLQSFT